jgi:hypothetical protein
MESFNEERRKKVVESLTGKIEKYEKLIESEKNKVPPEMFNWFKSKISRIMEEEEKKLHFEYEGRLWPKESQEYGLVKKVVENTHLYALIETYQENPQQFEDALKKEKLLKS